MESNYDFRFWVDTCVCCRAYIPVFTGVAVRKAAEMADSAGPQQSARRRSAGCGKPAGRLHGNHCGRKPIHRLDCGRFRYTRIIAFVHYANNFIKNLCIFVIPYFSQDVVEYKLFLHSLLCMENLSKRIEKFSLKNVLKIVAMFGMI